MISRDTCTATMPSYARCGNDDNPTIPAILARRRRVRFVAGFRMKRLSLLSMAAAHSGSRFALPSVYSRYSGGTRTGTSLFRQL